MEDGLRYDFLSLWNVKFRDFSLWEIITLLYRNYFFFLKKKMFLCDSTLTAEDEQRNQLSRICLSSALVCWLPINKLMSLCFIYKSSVDSLMQPSGLLWWHAQWSCARIKWSLRSQSTLNHPGVRLKLALWSECVCVCVCDRNKKVEYM